MAYSLDTPMRNRRLCGFSTLLLWIALPFTDGSALRSCSAQETTRPNILLFIADDWGLHAGVYGTDWVQTPAFDQVARNGILFENAYTPVAKCAPSRAILLTGRHAWQNAEAGNHMSRFPEQLRTWPETLVSAGWTVGSTGKGWGPGIANDEQGKPREMVGRVWNSRKTTPATQSISNIDYAANFADFLKAAPADRPWCFWCGTLEPHRAYEYQSGVSKGGKALSEIDRVPAYWPDNDIVRHDMLDYAYEVESVDAQLGRIVAELRIRGALDNTLLIVTSDHGMPFPRVKGYAYHDSNHIPLAMHWPVGIKSTGRRIADFVDFTDIAPTILDIAGLRADQTQMMPITGRSLRTQMVSNQHGFIEPERDHVLIGKERTDVGRPNDVGYPIRGLVTAEYLYLHNYEPTRWPAGNPETGYLDTDGSPTKTLILQLGRVDRSDRWWNLNFGKRPAEELFDLRTDRDCCQNLMEQQSSRGTADQLRTRMENELRKQNDPRMSGNGSVFDLYVPTNGAGFYQQYLEGRKPAAGWVNETDFEPAPLE
ncbi:MAG: sulfatase [Planctomyces sp.]|nr:sulfatase [Planctomyces sp.]